MLATACSPLLTPTHQTITYDSTCAPICTSHGCDVARTAVRNHRATHTRVLGVLSHEAHSTRRRRRWACIGRAGLPVPTGHPSPRPRRGNHTGGARLPPAAARRGLQHHGLRRFGARDARGARVVPNDADSCRECKAQALTSTDKELVLPSERCLMSHWTHRTPIFPIMYGPPAPHVGMRCAAVQRRCLMRLLDVAPPDTSRPIFPHVVRDRGPHAPQRAKWQKDVA